MNYINKRAVERKGEYTQFTASSAECIAKKEIINWFNSRYFEMKSPDKQLD